MRERHVDSMHFGRAAEYALLGVLRVRRRQGRFAAAAFFSCLLRSRTIASSF